VYILIVKHLLTLLLFISTSAAADQTNVWGDDGSLTIIQSESKPDVQLIVGEDSNTEIAVTPKEGETVFVYGDELTIIQDTPLGIIQY